MSLPFRLYLISDRSLMGPDPAGAVAALARAGLTAFQWREKDLTPAENYRHLRTLHKRLAVAENPAAPFYLFVNDRADLALALGLHVHLTEASLPTEIVRGLLPPGRLLGRSTHSLAGAREAEAAGADFITFGPVFHTPSKEPYGPPRGLDELREVCRRVSIPVVALGGIHRGSARACVEAGAAAAALIGAVWKAPDPVQALMELLREVDPGR